MHRLGNFFISKNLAKGEKMPNYRQWKVSPSDRCVEGPILLYLRAKGWFFDRVCQPGLRYCVLTKRGFLLIYMKDDKGFVLDIRRAFQVKSVSDNVSVLKTTYRRCRIKIRFNFGTVNIILTNGKIDLWRDHLLNATSAPSTKAITKQLALPCPDPDCVNRMPQLRPASSMYGPLDDVELSPSLVGLKSFSTAISDREASQKENWAKVKTPPTRYPSDTSVTCVDVSTCDDDYQCLSSRLAQIDEEETVAESGAETSTSGLFNHNSIRESNVPVGWLRRQLEHKIVYDRLRPIYVPPPSVLLEASTATSPSAVSPLMSKDNIDSRRPFYVPPPIILESSSTSTSPAAASPLLSRDEELPQLPVELDQTTVSKAVKSKKHVKFSKKRKSPMKASAKSVPSDSSGCELTRFNSFQFWRPSIFESDV